MEQAAIHFFHYLMSYDISKFNRQKIVKTDYAVDQAIESQPVWRFLRHSISCEYATITRDKEESEFLDDEKRDDEKTWSADTYLNLYYNWRVDTGITTRKDTEKERKAQREALKTNFFNDLSRINITVSQKTIKLSYNSVIQALARATGKADFKLETDQAEELPSDFWRNDPNCKAVFNDSNYDIISAYDLNERKWTIPATYNPENRILLIEGENDFIDQDDELETKN
jgi:hypothetical protein